MKSALKNMSVFAVFEKKKLKFSPAPADFVS